MKQFSRHTPTALLMLFICGVLILAANTLERPTTSVVFLDVGQGDAILIQNGTEQILIDGGQGNAVLTRLSEEMPWFDKKIELVVSSHPDRDHLEGLRHVLDQYEVELVVLPHIPHTSQLYDEWLKELQQMVAKKQTQYRFAQAGQTITLSQATLQILGPTLDTSGIKKTNNASIITKTTIAGLSFFMTGDAEASVERKLLSELPPETLNSDILKLGHHGSKTSSTQEFLEAVSPAATVISLGLKNQFGHPHPIVVERLKNYTVWRTDEQGSIRFIYEDDKWLVKTQH